jgi:hypothetical protein
MDIVWIAALGVLWVGLVQMVRALDRLQAGKGERP